MFRSLFYRIALSIKHYIYGKYMISFLACRMSQWAIKVETILIQLHIIHFNIEPMFIQHRTPTVHFTNIVLSQS